MRTQAIVRTIDADATRRAVHVSRRACLVAARWRCRLLPRGLPAAGPTDRAATVEGRLALFPAATQVVVAIDATRLRDSPAAAKLAALGTQSPEDKKLLDTFASRTGLDPMRQIDSVTLAFPEEARAHGEFGLVLRAETLDEARLIAYVRDELQKTGDDLVATPHGTYVLWSTQARSRRRRLLRRRADLRARRRRLGAAHGRPGRDRAPRATAPRPTSISPTWSSGRRGRTRSGRRRSSPRRRAASWPADPRFAAAASVHHAERRRSISARGSTRSSSPTLATAADARALATKATEALRDAKRNAQVLMLGLGPYLDGVTARADDKTFELQGGPRRGRRRRPHRPPAGDAVAGPRRRGSRVPRPGQVAARPPRTTTSWNAR